MQKRQLDESKAPKPRPALLHPTTAPAWDLDVAFKQQQQPPLNSAADALHSPIAVPSQLPPAHTPHIVLKQEAMVTPQAQNLQCTELSSEDLKLVAAAFSTPCGPEACPEAQHTQQELTHSSTLHIKPSPMMPQTTQKRHDYRIHVHHELHTQQAQQPQGWTPAGYGSHAIAAGGGGFVHNYSGLRNSSTQSETFCLRHNTGVTTSLFGIDEELQKLLGGGGAHGNGHEGDRDNHGTGDGGRDPVIIRGTCNLFSPGYGLTGLPF